MIRLALIVFVAALLGTLVANNAHRAAMRLPLKQVAPAATSPVPGAHLVPAAGRLHVGVEVWFRNHPIGTVTELTDHNPTTGAAEPGVKLFIDGRDNYWKLATLNADPSFQVPAYD